MTQQALVTGKVEYRQGEGVNTTIRPGPVEVQTTPTDATLSWADGETRGTAAMPIGEFQSYVSKGLIAWQGPNRMPRGHSPEGSAWQPSRTT